MNTMPVFAVEENAKASTATPKQFKSMVSKNKKQKTSDDYKFAYINLNWWGNFNDDILNSYIQKAEWKDVDGVYTKTNDIDTELVYTGNKRMDEVYYKAAKERDRIRTMTLRGHNTMHFGEGQPLSKKHIPEIALVTAPDYLCSVDRTGKAHMDKFDLGLMYEQLHTFVRCIEILDGMTRKEIGRSQPYSLGLGRLK